jgi:hypothetical protein
MTWIEVFTAREFNDFKKEVLQDLKKFNDIISVEFHRVNQLEERIRILEGKRKK